MSNIPISFRLPATFNIPEHIDHKGEKIPLPPSLRENFRLLLNAAQDADGAIRLLNSKVVALQTQVGKTTPAAPPSSAVATPGGVNDQTGVASYITQSSDYGSLLVVNNAGTGVPVTLNSSVASNFYFRVTNQGSVAATLTPDSTFSGATINGSANLSLGAGQSINVFYNGTTHDWFAY